MNRIPSVQSITSSSQLSQSITSSQLMQSSDLGQYKLSTSKNINGLDDSRRRDQIKYQKKISMYTQSIKERVLPKNISETASFIAATSQKMSRAESTASYNQNNITYHNTNANSNIHNMTNSKYTTYSQNHQIGSYPTILTTSRCQNSGIVQSVQSRKDNIPYLIQNIREEKQESSTTQGISSRDYTYRSMQSTHPNSGEQTNKFQFSRQQSSSQTPVKTFNKSALYNQNNSEQHVKPHELNDYSFKHFFTFNDNTTTQVSPDTLVSKETQESLSQLKMFTNSSDIISDSHKKQIELVDKPRNPFLKCEAFTAEKRTYTAPDYKNDSCVGDNLSDLSLSRIDGPNSMIQSTILNQQACQPMQKQQRDSCSFNFHQPSVIYNDDIQSKKNSINSNNNFLNFISQTVASKQGQQPSSYTSSMQFQEQKFIKSLIQKLHLINQNNQQNGSIADLTIEGSVVTGRVAPEQQSPSKKSTLSQLDSQENPNKGNDSLSKKNNNEMTPIKSTSQSKLAENNQFINNSHQQPQKQITIIRNSSQKSITPIKSLHQKSFSHTNLHSISKQSSQNSLQLTRESTLQSNNENNFNEVLKTEFSILSPIQKNTLSAVAERRRERMFYSFSLPENQNVSTIEIKHQVQNVEIEANTARLQKQQGWMCC